MTRAIPVLLLVAPCLLLLIDAAGAGSQAVPLLDVSSPGDGPPEDWSVMRKAGRGEPEITRAHVAGLAAVCLESGEDDSFSINRKVSVGLDAHPVLRFTWRVTELPKGGDVTRNSFIEFWNDNDQAAQLLVVFPLPNASWAMRRAFELAGEEEPVRAISYIWDTNARVGTSTEELAGAVRTCVVRSGDDELGYWVTIEQNVLADYERLFPGARRLDPIAIRYQINSQHTGTSAASCLASVEFRERAEAGGVGVACNP